jgi:hypothetical protein
MRGSNARRPQFASTRTLDPWSRRRNDLPPLEDAYTPVAVMPPDVSELQERAAHNESRYRALNERMEAHNSVHVWVDPPMPDWVCECASAECMQPVRLTLAEYEAVRTEPTHFFVVPSEEHLSPAVERVVHRHDRYWVVEKIGEAAEISEELDPST